MADPNPGVTSSRKMETISLQGSLPLRSKETFPRKPQKALLLSRWPELGYVPTAEATTDQTGTSLTDRE